jgi:hypothetical protein
VTISLCSSQLQDVRPRAWLNKNVVSLSHSLEKVQSLWGYVGGFDLWGGLGGV